MITYGRIRMSALGGIIVSLALLANPLAAFAASGWSPEVVISASQPSPAPNAFAINPSGNELWIMAPGVVGGYMVEASQRSFGGAWSPLTPIVSIHTGFLTTPQSLSASISTSGNEVAAWLVGGVQIALRSPSGVWQTPVKVATIGSPANLQAKLDAQGNGIAVWSDMTATGSVVEAVAWTAGGAFGNVVQLSQPDPSEFAPDLAVNEAGTGIVVWSAATSSGSTSRQIESSTRPAGGNWSAMTAVSPLLPLTSSARVALDGSGGATAVWQQGATYGMYAATRPAGGAWSSATEIETANPSFAGQISVATDAAGNATATWAAQDASGMSDRTATRPAGSSWGAPATLGPCASTCIPHLAVARDGSIAVVGWAPNGPTANAAVRLGKGTWVPAVVGSGNALVTYVVATNNAGASAVWPVGIHVAYHLALKQSDYR